MAESYDPPPSEAQLADLSPEDAQAKINQLMGACSRDRNHPYCDSGHPQKRDYTTYADRLYKIVGAADAERQEAERAEAIARMEAGIDVHTPALIKEAQGEMRKLVSLGYEEDEIPENIQPYQVAALKMQRLNAEGDTASLGPLMERELRNLNAPSSTVELLRSYVRTQDMDPDLRAGIFEKLISWIHQANKQLHGAKK